MMLLWQRLESAHAPVSRAGLVWADPGSTTRQQVSVAGGGAVEVDCSVQAAGCDVIVG